MSITNTRPQQQTLSIRVPESLREFLELAREFITDERGEAVSISDTAKFLLESARQDRLDFRLEAAELQQSPTAALVQIRTKWERQQHLSLAEWVLLARYVQVACEEVAATPDSLVAILEALLAVRALRVDRGGSLDRVYLGNLGVPVATAFSERQFDPEFLPQVVGDRIRDLRQSDTSVKDTVFAGRNLYLALREEAVTDIVTLNHRMTPFLGTLFRLAARGHWIRERQPLRISGEVTLSAPAAALSAGGPFQIAASANGDGELEFHLTMHSGGARYPIGPYPEIREFEIMLRTLQPGQRWNGLHFSASARVVEPERCPRVQFWRCSDRVALTFTEEEWRCLQDVFRDALRAPGLQPILDRLSLEYGDL